MLGPHRGLVLLHALLVNVMIMMLIGIAAIVIQEQTRLLILLFGRLFDRGGRACVELLALFFDQLWLLFFYLCGFLTLWQLLLLRSSFFRFLSGFVCGLIILLFCTVLRLWVVDQFWFLDFIYYGYFLLRTLLYLLHS